MAIEKRDSNAVLSPDGIREQISDLDIFMHYCSPFKSIGKKFNSELRDDIKPSSIISLVKGTPRYMDFGEPDHRFDSYKQRLQSRTCLFKAYYERFS